MLATVPPEAALHRLAVLELVLDVCLVSRDRACVRENAPAYAAAARAAPDDPRQAAVLADKADFFAKAAHVAEGEESPAPDIGESEDPVLAMRRHALAGRAHLSAGDDRLANRAVDALLARLASLENPQDNPFWVSHMLVAALEILEGIGDFERAWGVYRASREYLEATLTTRSADAAAFRIVEAKLLQQRPGYFAVSDKALEWAVLTLSQTELSPDAAVELRAEALTLKAAGCTLRSEFDCAREAFANHPFAPRFAAARAPADRAELGYLVARAVFSSSVTGHDAVAEQSLRMSSPLYERGPHAERNRLDRSAALAMMLPAGDTRRAALLAVGESMAAWTASAGAAPFRVGRQPRVVDYILTTAALYQAEGASARAEQEVVWKLLQLSARRYPAYDADAQTLLAAAPDQDRRRTTHRALRLQAKRDRSEREAISALAARAAGPSGGRPLRSAEETRRRFLDQAEQIEAAAAQVTTDAANLVSLAQLQAVLRPDEAAVSMAMLPGALSLMCVRKGEVKHVRTPVDLQQFGVDMRLLHAALTAAHAPSKALDSQYPVASAVRLYDTLLRPLEGCIRPGDHLVWLVHPQLVPLPMAALLKQPPARRGSGYDLASAPWLLRDHAITYASAASVVVAARSQPRKAAWTSDFLGVGNPRLTGAAPSGEVRQAILLRSVRAAPGLAALAALPETEQELSFAANGFRRTRLLLGEEATEQRVRREPLSGYRFLTFATHGLIRDELDGLTEPALALTPTSSADPLDDGLLTASEIADLYLTARLVALSACNTAQYDLSRFAADLPALSSAFGVAGAASTLATLWAVETNASKQIVAETMRSLAADRDVDAAGALAAAQRRYLAEARGKPQAHPRFWAPFIVLGDAGAPGHAR